MTPKTFEELDNFMEKIAGMKSSFNASKTPSSNARLRLDCYLAIVNAAALWGEPISPNMAAAKAKELYDWCLTE